MHHSKIVGYLAGCIGVLALGAALAKEPAQTVGPALSTPAGCTDSMRGRTHVLRFCGEKHYWIRTAVATLSAPGNVMPTGNSPDGPAQNWGGPQR